MMVPFFLPPHPDAAERLTLAGFPLLKVGEAWWLETDDPVIFLAAAVLVEALDEPWEQKAEVRRRIKAELTRRVDKLGDDRDVMALLDRGLELAEKRLDGNNWNAGDLVDVERGREFRRRIRRLRKAAEEIVEDVSFVQDPRDLTGFDPAASERWPS